MALKDDPFKRLVIYDPSDSAFEWPRDEEEAARARGLEIEPRRFPEGAKTALDAAGQGRIVAFGVKPERPATEYGYIRPHGVEGAAVLDVERFVEKPDVATAERLVGEGYLWNAGMFLFRADAVLAEFADDGGQA